MAFYQNKILTFTFNQDKSCIAIGTENGFMIYNTNPFKSSFKRDMKGGIGIIEMLNSSNILAFTGGGQNPKIDENKVVIWDDANYKPINELRFNSKVLNIKLKRTKIFVICKHKIYTFSFNEFANIDTIDTENPNGILGYALDTRINIIAYPTFKIGEIAIKNYDDDKQETININAHQSEISCLSMNTQGTLLATSSRKGTVIRIFEVRTRKLIQELRRGTETAEIFCLTFDKYSKHLACSSNRGTVHIFNVKYQDEKEVENTKSIFSGFLSSIGISNDYFNSEWSFSQFRINATCKTFVAFNEENPENVMTFSEDGTFNLGKYDLIKGGECKLEYNVNILNKNEDDDY